MRTKVRLDQDWERILREIAESNHKPSKKVLNDTLRSTLVDQAQLAQPEPFVQTRPMELRPGYAPSRSHRLADDLVAEAFQESTRKLSHPQP